MNTDYFAVYELPRRLMLDMYAKLAVDVHLSERLRGRGHGQDQRGVPVHRTSELARLARREAEDPQADLAERLHVHRRRQGQ